MARILELLFLGLLIGHSRVVAQTPAPPPLQKHAEEQLPDETSLPEEDESLAPKKYVLNPLEARRNLDIGNEEFKGGHYAGALSRFLDATHYNPNFAEAFLRVGETQEKLHNSKAAKAAFEKVIKLSPDSKFAEKAKKRLESIKG